MTATRVRTTAARVMALCALGVLAACGGGGGGGETPAQPSPPANRAPQITSAAVTTAVVGRAYAYALKASDPDGDSLTYSLARAPAGMAIEPTSGVISWTPAGAQAGNQPISVRVADPAGAAATQEFSVAVQAANRQPAINSSPVTAAVVGAAYRYDVAATDADGDTLAYSLTRAPAGMAIDAASGRINWTPTAGQMGTHEVALQVLDTGGLAATQSFTVAVSVGNAAPQITSAPVAAATTGSAYSYPVVASDPNGDTLTYSLTQAPAGMSINAASGLIGWTPAAGQAGSHAVTVRVADPAGLAATQAFAVVVNGAPQITTTAVTSAPVGAAYQYDADATDPNGDALTYSLTQAPAGMTIVAGSGLIRWTPTGAQTGSHPVTVRAADPGGLAATQSFTVLVPNAPPVITSTALTTAGVGVTYAYDVNASDLNGDTLTYSLTQSPGGMSINAASGLISWVPLSGQVGGHAVTVRVADPGGLGTTQSFTLVAGGGTRVDLATPATYTANAGSAVGITLNWGRVPMALNYQQFMHLVNAAGQVWSVDDHMTTSASWAAGNFTQTRTVTVPAGVPSGTYDIRVGLSGGNPWLDLVLATGAGVTDPGGDRRYRVGTLTVFGNEPPQITSTAVTTASVGAPYSYDVNATDPNAGDVLTYSLTFAPAGMTINASNGLIAWTPTAGQAGNQPVSVRVADAGGRDATQTFTVNVAPLNGSPVITSTPGTTATAGVAYSYDVNATDPTGEAVSYSLTQAPAGMSISATSGLIAWMPSTGQVGSHGVTVRAADPGGLAGTQTFTLNVSAAPTGGAMTMSCADGAGTQCSGSTILRTDHGVALTRSSVQVYGRSTSDMLPVNPNLSNATGLALASGGTAELRVRKDGSARPSTIAFLLSNMSILWDGVNNRPLLIETFNPTAGRAWLDGNGVLMFGPLPPSADLAYYNYATAGAAGGNKANYANNRYFPRTAPPRCSPGGWCATLETSGPSVFDGSWRTGGSDPDRLLGTRFHEDGDVHAGDGLPDANGNPTWLAGGTGLGVPMPGSKGYRSIDHWSYQYANLASWFTQDTINIVEWGGTNEHNKNRRGFVAYGDTTTPASVPTAGTATYTGVVRGRYAPNALDEPAPFIGTVAITVNFATRSVSVSIQNTVLESTGAAVPVALSASLTLGSADNANHLSGAAAIGALSGGLGARLFGPVASGGSGSGPAEMGGVLSLSNSGTGAAVVAGFIARKQ
jgi:hypothetical protein